MHGRFINQSPQSQYYTLDYDFILCIYVLLIYSLWLSNCSELTPLESVTGREARASVIMLLCSSKINSLVAVFELVFTDGMQEAELKFEVFKVLTKK